MCLNTAIYIQSSSSQWISGPKVLLRNQGRGLPCVISISFLKQSLDIARDQSFESKCFCRFPCGHCHSARHTTHATWNPDLEVWRIVWINWWRIPWQQGLRHLLASWSYGRDKPFQPHMSLSSFGMHPKETREASDIRKHLLILEHPYQWRQNTQQMWACSAGVKGMSSMKKKNQEEMEIDTSRFFYLFVNMPLTRLIFF